MVRPLFFLSRLKCKSRFENFAQPQIVLISYYCFIERSAPRRIGISNPAEQAIIETPCLASIAQLEIPTQLDDQHV